MKKNFLLTLIFACFPGFGEMYQGYMKRGISITLWFCVTTAIATMLQLGPLAFLLAVIWAYSFFDTFNIRGLTDEQRAGFHDDYIPNTVWLQQNHLDKIIKKGKGGKIAGWALIVLGVLALYNNLLRTLIYNVVYYLDFSFLWTLYYNLGTIIFAVIVILVGLWVLRRNAAASREQDEEIVPYKGDGDDAH